MFVLCWDGVKVPIEPMGLVILTPGDKRTECPSVGLLAGE
jgi:hypothetical protein